MADEQKSQIKVSYTKSSSKEGNCGYSIDVTCVSGATQKEMEDLANLSLKTARAIRDKI